MLLQGGEWPQEEDHVMSHDLQVGGGCRAPLQHGPVPALVNLENEKEESHTQPRGRRGATWEERSLLILLQQLEF